MVDVGTDAPAGNTLRNAIVQANASGESATISFDPGVSQITLASDLPKVTVPVLIDGTTADGVGATTKVRVDGSTHAGLFLSAGNSTIENVWIENCSSGISLSDQGGDVVRGCYIGAVSGDQRPNITGLVISDTSPGNTIGGTTPADRNIISGNSDGIACSGGPIRGSVIEGNWIGTSVNGSTVIGNNVGVLLMNNLQQPSVGKDVVGGTEPAAANYIVGARSAGISLVGGSYEIIGNDIGIMPASADTNLADGGNYIGISTFLSQANNVIGGLAPGATNIVAHSRKSGVVFAQRSEFSGNSIFDNGGYWGSDAVENPPVSQPIPNGGVDAFPVLTGISSSSNGENWNVSGTLDSLPNMHYRIVLFK